MTHAKELQRQHEKAICDELVTRVMPALAFRRMGNDAREPDVIYSGGNKTVGIEVGTVYYDNSDAEQVWTLARGERRIEGVCEPRWGGVLVNPDDVMCSRIQEMIKVKCGKRYVGTDEVWLCIGVDAPLGDSESFKKCASQIVLPPHSFVRMFLLCRLPIKMTSRGSEGGSYEAITLY